MCQMGCQYYSLWVNNRTGNAVYNGFRKHSKQASRYARSRNANMAKCATLVGWAWAFVNEAVHVYNQ